ncbi:MAG TPA: hypothetical protein VHG08_08390 [Longimicrobium sp.]|nr:hypothetical protein [Longimicrobium sp.]
MMVTNSAPSRARNTGTGKPRRRNTERLTFTGSFIVVDFVLRLIVLDLWIYFDLSDVLFWSLQVGGITATILLLVYWKYNRLLEKHAAKHIVVEGGPWALILVLFVVVSGTVAAYSATEDWNSNSLRLLFTVVSFGLYGSYIGILYLFSASGRPWSPPPEEQHVVEHADDLDPIDHNDLRIANMETDTFSITHRVESYTLESALFGALAFSGFLTLLAADQPVLPKIELLRRDIQAVWGSLRTESLEALQGQMAARFTADDVIAALTVQTVCSSMLFLLVIISRLRFYNILKRVDHSVRSARAMNDKEDAVHLLILETRGQNPELLARRAYLTRRVNQFMNDAETSFNHMQPLVRYMWVFRTLGIGMFLLILLTSAFIISVKLSLGFLVLSISAYVYMHLHEWIDVWKSWRRGRRRTHLRLARTAAHKFSPRGARE